MSGGGMGRGAALGVLATAVEKLGALGVALWLPRHLGLADYGHYTFVVALLALVQGLPDASLEAVLVARMAPDPAMAPALAGPGAVVRAVVSFVGGALGLVAVVAASGEPALLAPAACWAAGLLIAAANPFRSLLRAELRLGRYLAAAVGQTAALLAALAVAVHADGGLVAVMAAAPVGALAGLVLGRVLAGRPVRLAGAGALARTLLVAAGPLGGATLLLMGAQQAVAVLLLRTHGAAALGLYGGAQRLLDAVNLLPQAIGVSLLPALARGGAATHARTAGDAARLLVLLVAPLLAVCAAWPAELLGVVLGAGFVEAAPALRALAGVGLLAATGSVLTAVCVASGLERLLLATTAASAVVVLGVGAALVPRLGPLGAGLATVIGMAAGQLVLCVAAAARHAAAVVARAALGPALLAAALAGALAATGAGLGMGVVAFGACYAGGLALTGLVRVEDLRRWSA